METIDNKLKRLEEIIITALGSYNDLLRSYVDNFSPNDYNGIFLDKLDEFCTAIYDHGSAIEHAIEDIVEKYENAKNVSEQPVADCCDGDIDDTIRTINQIMNDTKLNYESSFSSDNTKNQYLDEIKKMGY